ncbi:acyloxyacyl hydrolase [Flaviaesturariibacter terrae]
MSFRFRLLLLLTVLCCPAGAQILQEDRFGLSTQLGSFITKMSKAELAKDSYSFLVQADWSHRSAYAPGTFLGATLLHGASGGARYLGTVSAAMGFADHAIAGSGWYSLRGRFALGLGWIQKPYDPLTNHKNTLLGSHLNAAVQASLYQQVRIGRHWSWNSGISFLHLSNGLSKLPNLGLNIPCLYTGLQYRVAGGPLRRRPEPFAAHRQQLALWAALGVKQWPLVNSPRTLTNVFSAEWSKRLSTNGRWGAVLHVFHDPTELSPNDTTFTKPAAGGWQAGVGGHYTVVIGRWEMPLQMGVYAWNPRDANHVYQILGLRLRVHEHWLAGIHLKTHMGKADYFNAGIGYQW